MDKRMTAAEVVAELAQQNVRMLALDSQTVRAVTHLGVSLDETAQACGVIKRIGRD